MIERSITHATFTIERTYPASTQRVFGAWADPKIKARWFGGPQDANHPGQFDFRVGGRESSAGKGPDGNDYTFEVLYQDIIPDQRIVYTYEMTLGGKRISVSVASIELKPEGKGTHMKVTELGAYLDGLDNAAQRETGTNWLMDQLGAELARQTADA
jgi:uncharacterized protein YndB with AHSA1/START domain